jgi:hypothetical protein
MQLEALDSRSVRFKACSWRAQNSCEDVSLLWPKVVGFLNNLPVPEMAEINPIQLDLT